MALVIFIVKVKGVVSKTYLGDSTPKTPFPIPPIPQFPSSNSSYHAHPVDKVSVHTPQTVSLRDGRAEGKHLCVRSETGWAAIQIDHQNNSFRLPSKGDVILGPVDTVRFAGQKLWQTLPNIGDLQKKY